MIAHNASSLCVMAKRMGMHTHATARWLVSAPARSSQRYGARVVLGLYVALDAFFGLKVAIVSELDALLDRGVE
jgi:hypothetical protein